MVVSRMFQVCFKEVAMVFQECFKGNEKVVSTVFHKVVAGRIQGVVKSVSNVLPERAKEF